MPTIQNIKIFKILNLFRASSFELRISSFSSRKSPTAVVFPFKFSGTQTDLISSNIFKENQSMTFGDFFALPGVL